MQTRCIQSETRSTNPRGDAMSQVLLQVQLEGQSKRVKCPFSSNSLCTMTFVLACLANPPKKTAESLHVVQASGHRFSWLFIRHKRFDRLGIAARLGDDVKDGKDCVVAAGVPRILHRSDFCSILCLLLLGFFFAPVAGNRAGLVESRIMVVRR